jgi:hypothetical protein
MTQAPVTDWPVRMLLVALVFAVIAGILLLMRRGWRARGRRQDFLPAPNPWAQGEPVFGPVQGIFLGTVFAGDWLNRVVVHGLGVRSRVNVVLTSSSLELDREGAESFSIPLPDLVAVRSDRGIAGKAFERGGMAVVTWNLGGTMVESGIRTTHMLDQDALISMIEDRIDRPQVAGDEQRDERPTQQ